MTEMMSRIDTITVEEFIKLTNATYRDNPEFMLEVISKNPSLYVCLSEKLKVNTDFIQLLISEVPEIENTIKADEQKRQDGYKQKEKEKQERKLDLENDTSKILFCKKYNMDIEQLNNAIKEVSIVYPEIATKVATKNERMSTIHLRTVESINSKLLSSEMTLEQYSREDYKGKKVDTLLRHITDVNKRKQFQTLVVKAIASGKLTMMDYMRLFSEEHDYKTIINSINQFMKTASKEMPELQGKDKSINIANIEIKSLKKYSKPYQSKDFVNSSKGFVNSEGKTIIVQITEEYIAYARKYLQIEDEYICYTTMNSALSKLVKGEVTFEDIDKRITKKISMKSVVTNAINNGITTEQVKYYDLVEQSKLQEKSIEGETIDG